MSSIYEGVNFPKMLTAFSCWLLSQISSIKWDRVFKSGLSKFRGRQPLTNLKGYGLLKWTVSLQSTLEYFASNVLDRVLKTLLTDASLREGLSHLMSFIEPSGLRWWFICYNQLKNKGLLLFNTTILSVSLVLTLYFI